MSRSSSLTSHSPLLIFGSRRMSWYSFFDGSSQSFGSSACAGMDLIDKDSPGMIGHSKSYLCLTTWIITIRKCKLNK